MLSPKEELFCQNLEIKRMSQRLAYLDAYPKSKAWKPKTVDERACRLARSNKIVARCEELRASLNEEIRQEAKWTRQDAFEALKWMMDKAKEEAERKGELTGPCVSAITNATKELNTIFAIMENDRGRGVLEDILSAVRGIDND